MKIKHFALLLAIVLMASIVGISGYRLKNEVIVPLGLEEYMDKSVFELPFLARVDDELSYYVENADTLLANPSQPWDPSAPTTSADPSEPSTGEPTVPTPGTDGSQPSGGESTTPQPTMPMGNGSEPVTDFPDGVDDSWFENTLFIGDSRMQGLSLYARSGNAHYFCKQSLNFSSVFKQSLSDKGNFSDMTLEQLLCENQYDKIIVNFGLNEAGYSESWFRQNFDVFMTKIRSWQPNAKIILNGIMPVTKGYIAASKYGSCWEPEKLRQLSQIMASYANGTDVFYIDCTACFADSDGYLFESLTGDGCHPTATHYKTWRSWMNFALSTLGI